MPPATQRSWREVFQTKKLASAKCKGLGQDQPEHVTQRGQRSWSRGEGEVQGCGGREVGSGPFTASPWQGLGRCSSSRNHSRAFNKKVRASFILRPSLFTSFHWGGRAGDGRDWGHGQEDGEKRAEHEIF